MCGRYTISTPVDKLAEEFGLAGELPDLQSSYNVAPAQEAPADCGHQRWETVGDVEVGFDPFLGR